MIRYTKRLNIILIALVFLRFLFSGKSNKKPQLPPKKIVAVFLTRNIGDMIFATPVFRAIKQQYPDASLTVVGSTKNHLLTEGNQDIDHYIECPSSAFELIKLIKAEKADYAFSFSPSVVDGCVLYLATIPSIAMFSIQNARAHTLGYTFIRPLFIKIPFYIGHYYAREYLRILEPIEIHSTNIKKHLFFTENGNRAVKGFLDKHNISSLDRIAIFSPGAGTKIKQWPAKRFAEVADYISETYGIKIAVIGGPGDKNETELFRQFLKKTTPLIYVDSSLDELKAFIARGYLLIANDSGPVYFAEAFDVPTLVVVGPTDENEHPPRGVLNRIVTAHDRGKPELMGHLGDHDAQVAHKQITGVKVEDVIKELDSLFVALATS